MQTNPLAAPAEAPVLIEKSFPTPELAKAHACLTQKQGLYANLRNYYTGDQPLVYSTAKLHEIFKNINAQFMQNWCTVVVGAVMDRLALTGFETGNGKANQVLATVFAEEMLDLTAFDVHEDALVFPEAALIAWPNDEDVLEIHRQDPAMIHVEYDEANPKKKLWAAKWWRKDKRLYITLYFPEKLQYFRTAQDVDPNSPAPRFEDYIPEGEESAEPENPFAPTIPVFHFCATPRKVSSLKNAITIQDAINKLFNDMMIAAEFGAFPQRWAITQSDTSDLKAKPNGLWALPPADSMSQPVQVGQFESVQLENFIRAVENLINTLSAITQTPKHYFFQQQGELSGEALLTLEAPLVKKVERYIRRFTATWQEFAAFVLEVNGIKDVPMKKITVNFAVPASVQPQTQAETRKANVDSGIPLPIALAWEGRKPDEIEKIMAEVDKKKQQETANLAQALREQQRRFDNGEGQAE